MFKGLALGGPLDGKSIVHVAPNYKAPELTKLEPYVSFNDMAEAALQIDVFTYIHFETPGGDVWIPSAVANGDRYEHKLWDHPLEYIFSKLMRGYKPDGY